MSEKKKRSCLKRLAIWLALPAALGIWYVSKLIWFTPLNIDHFFERTFISFALAEPELLSSLRMLEQFGIRGHNAKLSDESDQHLLDNMAFVEKSLNMLRSYDRDALNENRRLSYDILEWYLQNELDAKPYYQHNYPVNQLFGVQSGIITFMAETHHIGDITDAEHYIARLNLFDEKFGAVMDKLAAREARGIIPPKFVIEKVLLEVNSFLATPAEQNILITSFEERLQKIDATTLERDRFMEQANQALETVVHPVYRNLTAYLEQLLEKATTDDGAWKHPGGEAFYANRLKNHTTTNMTAEEIHQLGLSEVARIEGEMRAILDELGHEGGTPGEWMQRLAADERFLYPNTDDGRKQIIAGYQKILDHIDKNLTGFDLRPNIGVEVRPIPAFKQKTAPSAYYNTPAMDGSRPGVFYANLRDLNECPTWSMPTLAYHEAIPGHHFQLSIQQELTGVPTFRKIIPFTAYSEGWALYAERLAWELGFYENDPYGNLGRLQDEIYRGVRLVVDTGIHAKKWTREQAIDYMIQKTGKLEGEVVAEIERYIVDPGQACAYKVGQLKILELRERAKAQLGDKFRLSDFHNVVLANGAVPLEILEQLVENYIAKTR